MGQAVKMYHSVVLLLVMVPQSFGFQSSYTSSAVRRNVIFRLSEDEDADALRARAAALREEAAALQADVEKDRQDSVQKEAPKRATPPRPSPPPSPVTRKEPKSDIPWSDRALASIPYVLPLSDALPYGKYVFQEFPEIATLTVAPFFPFIALITAIPLGQLICFVALSFGSRNPSFPRFSRFSFQQAILMDISLIFPQLLGTIFGVTSIKFPESIVEPASTTIFFFILASTYYSIFSNVRGQLPNGIPLFSETTDRTIGPF